MGTPDNCWRWGIFYVNPDDPALFVKKRYGLGHTLNFGKRWSWAIVALLVFAIPHDDLGGELQHARVVRGRRRLAEALYSTVPGPQSRESESA